MADTYEVEVKSLLGSSENADALRAKLTTLDSTCVCTNSYTQLNHYFEGGTIASLQTALAPLLSDETNEKLLRIAEEGHHTSVRSRETSGEVRVVVKASLGSDSSANGVTRIEIEEVVPLTFAELDERILSAGFTYQAKWSRSREEYQLGNVAVCLDKNAGYGYVAEFERVVEDTAQLTKAREDIEALMKALEVTELPQDRLERMFAHYNEHWAEYYGTDKIFVIN